MLKNFKKLLTQSQTTPESILWYNLRNRTVTNTKFRRQHILEGYIVDFVCLEKKLIIELDGSKHADRVEYDAHRTQVLEKKGFRVLRFWNNDVFYNLEGVLEVIYVVLEGTSTPHPPLRGDLSHKGRGERKKHGFSLIELMIVVGIIGILAVMAIPSYQNYTKRARFVELIAAIEPFKIAVALALQTGIAIEELQNGTNGIPTALTPTKNLASITVENGIVTATATTLLDNVTYQLTPNEDGTQWTVSGSCLEKGYCHAG